MPHGVIRFCWREANGDITNWWSSQLAGSPKRFVHTEWGKFAVAIDLERREAQIVFNTPPEWRTVKLDELPDESIRLAFDAVCDTQQAGFAAELILRAIGRDDLADAVTPTGRPT